MASTNVNNGKFYIIDLETQDGPCVAVIPDFWYHEGGLCYYPLKRGEVAASKREQPNPSTWGHYKCVYRALFDSFQDARKKVTRAVEVSDFNTASEAEETRYGRGKRVKKPRTQYSPTREEPASTDDVESSGSEDNTSSIIPPAPINMAETLSQSLFRSNGLSQSQSQTSTIGFYSSNNIETQQQSTQSTSSVQIHGGTQSFPSVSDNVRVPAVTPLLPFHQDSLPTDVTLNVPARPSHASSPRCSQRFPASQRMEQIPTPRVQTQQLAMLPRGPSPVLGTHPTQQLPLQPQSKAVVDNEMVFQVKVGRYLSSLSEKMDQLAVKLGQLSEKVENAVSKPTPINDPAPLVEIAVIPIKAVDELVLYEELLTNDIDQFFKLVRLIKSIGGTTISDAVKRAWERVLSVEVRAVCNWLGQPRKDKPLKRGLKDSKVTEAIFRGIRLASQFSGTSDTTLEFETKKAMKHAPESVKKKALGIVESEDSD